MNPEEAPGVGVGGSLSTAHPQIHAGGGEGRTLRPVSQQATVTPGWLSRLQGWDAVSPPHWRFGAGVQGVCPFWAPWARWPQRRLEQGLPLSLPPAARPVWAVFRDGRAGPGWAAGASPWGPFSSSSFLPSQPASSITSPILFLLQKEHCRCWPQLPPQTPLAAVVRAGCQLERLAYLTPSELILSLDTFSSPPPGPIACLASALASSVRGWSPHPIFQMGSPRPQR